MPRKKKSAGTAIDPRNGQSTMRVFADDLARRTKPPAPKGLAGDARKVWDAFWADPVSTVVRDAEVYLVRRWAANYARYLNLLAIADKDPIVTGSTGQQVVNPALTAAMRIEPGLRYDEMQFGFGPKNRADLGISILAGTSTMDQMNAEHAGGGGDGGNDGAKLYALPSPEHEDQDDPRRDQAR